ncbi:hypothetical protein [Promicromonospora soli]
MTDGTGGVPLARCAVVIDSRNLNGAIRGAFGLPSAVTWAGVRAGLRRHGLDAVSCAVGTATRVVGGSKSSSNVARAQKKNLEFRDRLVDEGAEVLEGILAQRDDKMEEKQVDVLCALKVADLAAQKRLGQIDIDAIVVLSEDMDLVPAYLLAENYGVPTYAAATQTVYKRQDQANWLLLDEGILAEFASPSGRRRGLGVRNLVAKIVVGDVRDPLRWSVFVPSASPGSPALLTTNSGLKGRMIENSLKRKDKADLHAVGVTVDPSGRFPFLELGRAPVAGPMAGISRGKIEYWAEPTRVAVRLDGGSSVVLTAPIGAGLPGESVAVLTTSGRQGGRYFVGPLDRSTPVLPTEVTVESPANGSGWHYGTTPDGLPAGVHAGTARLISRGDRLIAVAVSEPSGSSAMTQYMPLSTALPTVSRA